MTTSFDLVSEGSVRAILLEALQTDNLRLGADEPIRNIAGVDSMKILRIISTIERRYDVELEDETVFKIETLNELVVAIQAAQRAGSADRAGE